MNIKSLSLSTIITMIFIALVTVWAELSKPFKDSLVSLTGHHWVTKGVLSLVLFIVLYFLFSGMSKDSKNIQKYAYYVFAIAILCGLIIIGFYAWHFLTGG